MGKAKEDASGKSNMRKLSEPSHVRVNPLITGTESENNI